jgi:hypothetical protein
MSKTQSNRLQHAPFSTRPMRSTEQHKTLTFFALGLFTRYRKSSVCDCLIGMSSKRGASSR